VALRRSPLTGLTIVGMHVPFSHGLAYPVNRAVAGRASAEGDRRSGAADVHAKPCGPLQWLFFAFGQKGALPWASERMPRCTEVELGKSELD
jgi:hypothetical protein